MRRDQKAGCNNGLSPVVGRLIRARPPAVPKTPRFDPPAVDLERSPPEQSVVRTPVSRETCILNIDEAAEFMGYRTTAGVRTLVWRGELRVAMRGARMKLPSSA